MTFAASRYGAISALTCVVSNAEFGNPLTVAHPASDMANPPTATLRKTSPIPRAMILIGTNGSPGTSTPSPYRLLESKLKLTQCAAIINKMMFSTVELYFRYLCAISCQARCNHACGVFGSAWQVQRNGTALAHFVTGGRFHTIIAFFLFIPLVSARVGNKARLHPGGGKSP